MRRPLFLVITAFTGFFVSGIALADAELSPAGAINGKSFTLVSGDTVRLAGLEAPNVEEKADGMHSARLGEPLGEEAKAALHALLAGHKLRIDSVSTGRDRHNRMLGQVYRDDGLWIQGEMLKEGWAMVYSFPDDNADVVKKMLALEHAAQTEKRGIWANPYFRIITPEETPQFVNRFKIVEGKILSVHDYHGHIYVNFSEHWKGNFALFISRKYADAFAPLNLPALVGKTIRVRGWIDYHAAPVINLTHPAQIEVE